MFHIETTLAFYHKLHGTRVLIKVSLLALVIFGPKNLKHAKCSDKSYTKYSILTERFAFFHNNTVTVALLMHR